MSDWASVVVAIMKVCWLTRSWGWLRRCRTRWGHTPRGTGWWSRRWGGRSCPRRRPRRSHTWCSAWRRGHQRGRGSVLMVIMILYGTSLKVNILPNSLYFHMLIFWPEGLERDYDHDMISTLATNQWVNPRSKTNTRSSLMNPSIGGKSMCVSTTLLSIIDTKAIIPMADNEDSNNSPFAFCKVNIRTERNITGYLQADRNCNVQFYHAEQSSALSTL